MAFRVVHYHIVAGKQRVDYRHNALVAIIEQITVFFSDKMGQFGFQFAVLTGFARHHARAHWVREAPFGGAFGIGLAYFGVVGEAQVIVDTPTNYFTAFKKHSIAQCAFEAWEHVVTFGHFGVFAKWAGLFQNSIEQIHLDTGMIIEKM
jgi:hypothetical protein